MGGQESPWFLRVAERPRSRYFPPAIFGEESLASVLGLRPATATAANTCTALKISRSEMIRAMHDEPTFADFFLKFLLARSMRTQADLVDQLFNSSEKRLARILLLMAEFGRPGEPETLIPPVTQETLAEMIGTTRSRVSFFMNRFRKLGLIDYSDRIHVYKSLLNVVLLDHLPERNSGNPAFDFIPGSIAGRDMHSVRKAREERSDVVFRDRGGETRTDSGSSGPSQSRW